MALTTTYNHHPFLAPVATAASTPIQKLQLQPTRGRRTKSIEIEDLCPPSAFTRAAQGGKEQGRDVGQQVAAAAVQRPTAAAVPRSSSVVRVLDPVPDLRPAPCPAYPTGTGATPLTPGQQLWHDITATPYFDTEAQQQVSRVEARVWLRR